MLNVLILLTKFYDMHEHILLVGFNGVRWFNNKRELSRSMILGSPLDFNLLTQRRCQLFWTLLIFKSSHYILLHNAFVFSFSIFSSLGLRCCWNSAVGLSIAVIKNGSNKNLLNRTLLCSGLLPFALGMDTHPKGSHEDIKKFIRDFWLTVCLFSHIFIADLYFSNSWHQSA